MTSCKYVKYSSIQPHKDIHNVYILGQNQNLFNIFCHISIHLLPESFQTHLKRVIGNSQGGGGPKAKIYKGKYEPKLKFLEGRSNQTTLPPFHAWDGYGCFLEQHINQMYEYEIPQNKLFREFFSSKIELVSMSEFDFSITDSKYVILLPSWLFKVG